MITERAKRISRLAKRAKGGRARSLATVLYDELVAHCTPTRVEFARITDGVILTGRGLWDLVLHIPQWRIVELMNDEGISWMEGNDGDNGGSLNDQSAARENVDKSKYSFCHRE